MTTKHDARFARDNLHVTKQRAASAMTAAQKRTFEARQRVQREKTREARALSALSRQIAQEKAAESATTETSSGAAPEGEQEASSTASEKA